ncbi:hypothetical protein FA13DRAFT_1776343, partial [Coprinellus micaceus]
MEIEERNTAAARARSKSDRAGAAQSAAKARNGESTLREVNAGGGQGESLGSRAPSVSIGGAAAENASAMHPQTPIESPASIQGQTPTQPNTDTTNLHSSSAHYETLLTRESRVNPRSPPTARDKTRTNSLWAVFDAAGHGNQIRGTHRVQALPVNDRSSPWCGERILSTCEHDTSPTFQSSARGVEEEAHLCGGERPVYSRRRTSAYRRPTGFSGVLCVFLPTPASYHTPT